MAIVFPNNNLPTAAQPWAREITKQLANLMTSTTAAQINNAARDTQLANSIQSLIDGARLRDGTITADKISASYVYAGEIEAEQITAGTLSGITIESSSAASRITISASTTFPSIIFNSDGYGQVGAIYSQYLSSSGYAGIYLDAPNISMSGPLYAGSGINSDGTITANAGISTTAGTVIGPAGGVYPTNGTETGTANVIQASSGAILRRTSSARKYKLDIQDVEYGLKALELRPRTWIDKTQYEENGNSAEGLRRIPGFVAEEVEEAGLTELVKYNEEGEVESLHYDRIVSALIPVLRQQQAVIEELTQRIETLEKGA